MSSVAPLIIVVAVLSCSSESEKPATAYHAAIADLTKPERAAAAMQVIKRRWSDKERAVYSIPPGSGPVPQAKGDSLLRENLLRLLSSSTQEVRKEAALMLSYLRAPGHDPRLLECAANSDAYYECTRALMIVADPAALRAMVPYVSAPRKCALDRPGCTSAGPDGGGSHFAVHLGELGLKGLPYLEEAAMTGSLLALERAAAELEVHATKGATEELRRAAIASLKRIAAHQDWRRRYFAVLVLGAVGTTETDSIRPFTRDDSVFVRDVAHAALLGGARRQAEPDWHRMGSRGPYIERAVALAAQAGCWSAFDTRKHLEVAGDSEPLWAHVRSGLRSDDACCRAAAAIVRGAASIEHHEEIDALQNDPDQRTRAIVASMLAGNSVTNLPLPCK